MLRRILRVAAIIAVAPGCSTVTGWFGGKSSPSDPAKLTKLDSSIGIAKVWSVGLGDGERRLWLRQHPVLDGNRIYATNDDGEVVALDAATGKSIWVANAVNVERTGSWVTFWKRKAAEAGLTSSPGVGEGLVVAGGRNCEVVAFSADSGEKKWESKVSSEVLSAPRVAGDRVIVRSNDGRVFGLDAADGSRKWVFDRGLPALSVRGNATPVGANGLTFIGYDDGTVVALRDQDGLQAWSQAVAEPEGRTELERMADIDGEMILDGDQLYVASAHDKVMIIDADDAKAAAVITGSYNFTKAAQYRNGENVLVLRGNPALAQTYRTNWQRHLAHARPYKSRNDNR